MVKEKIRLLIKDLTLVGHSPYVLVVALIPTIIDHVFTVAEVVATVSGVALMNNNAVQFIHFILNYLSPRRFAVNRSVHERLQVEDSWVLYFSSYFAPENVEALDGHDQDAWRNIH